MAIIKIFQKIFALFCLVCSVLCAKPFIALVLPFEHQAMNDIESGLLAHFPHDVKTFRAHGDMALLSQILNKIKNDGYRFIVPVGTSTSQMTVSVFEKNKQTTIICAAAHLSQNILNSNKERIYVINDQVLPDEMLRRIQPYVKKIAFLYSNSEKSFEDMSQARSFASALSLNFEEKVIQQVQDIPIALRSLPKQIDAVFIFKDHLIVSALPYLVQEAQKRKIPLIVSDLSSVQKGATMAYGVEESQIGYYSGALIAALLRQESSPQVIDLADYAQMLYNPEMFAKQNILPQGFWDTNSSKGVL